MINTLTRFFVVSFSIAIGRSRGFGFVTFADDEGANAAIQQFNDQEFEGRQIKVDRASERSNTGGNRGGFRGGYNTAPRYNNNQQGGGYGGTFFSECRSLVASTLRIDTSGDIWTAASKQLIK